MQVALWVPLHWLTISPQRQAQTAAALVVVVYVNKQFLFFEITHLYVPSIHPPVPATTGVQFLKKSLIIEVALLQVCSRQYE